MIVNQKNNVIEANIKEYEILTFDQYLDLSEDRKVTNTWYISLSKNHDANKYVRLLFAFLTDLDLVLH